MLLKAFQGFCMAPADSVPGVSGGTVAFIMGFYENFIDALHALFGKDSEARKRELSICSGLESGGSQAWSCRYCCSPDCSRAISTFWSSRFPVLPPRRFRLLSPRRTARRDVTCTFTFIGMFIVIGLSALRQGSIGFLLDFAALSDTGDLYFYQRRSLR